MARALVTKPNPDEGGPDLLHVSSWSQSHGLGTWWLQSFLFLLVDAVCIVHFSFPLLPFDYSVPEMSPCFLLLLISLPTPTKWLPSCWSKGSKRNGGWRGALCHLEANVLLAFLTGPLRMCFFHKNAASVLGMSFRYILHLKR